MTSAFYKKKQETAYYTYIYKDKPTDELKKQLENSATLYVGNLSFYTTEEQIWELFSKCGAIKRIIMGLNKKSKTPCGFCFVEYYTHEEAANCVKFINGTKLDDRTIRTDWDPGFTEGRQYGRGSSGGQVRDEYRTDYDPGRGGYGKQTVKQFAEFQNVPGMKRGREEEEEEAKKRPKLEEKKEEIKVEKEEKKEEKKAEEKREEKNPRFRDD